MHNESLQVSARLCAMRTGAGRFSGDRTPGWVISPQAFAAVTQLGSRAIRAPGPRCAPLLGPPAQSVLLLQGQAEGPHGKSAWCCHPGSHLSWSWTLFPNTLTIGSISVSEIHYLKVRFPKLHSRLRLDIAMYLCV